MIITCFRCGKELNSPDISNADYVIARDMIAREKREALFAVKKSGERVGIRDVAEARLMPDLERVEVRLVDEDIQKTGIVCPDCYKETDTLIWGVHKEDVQTK